MKNLCDGGKDYIFWDKDAKPLNREEGYDFWSSARPEGVKRKRVICPKCGRKIWTSVYYDHDGDVYHTMPEHKPKGWWKKKKKVTHKEKGRQV